MSHPNTAPDTLSVLNAARESLHHSRVEHATALAQLDAGRTKYLADSTAKHQAAVISAEENARFAELRTAAKHTAFEAAKAAHAAHVESEKRAELDAARAAVSHDKFVAACANTVKRRAELRARLAESDADIEKLVRGYATEAKACGATPIDYLRLAESLTLRASGLDAASVLTRAWGASPPPSMTALEALESAEHGTSPALVNAKLAALRDAVRRENVAAEKVARGLFVGPKADPSTVPLGQLTACGAEIDCVRAELVALGFSKSQADVQSSELASRLRKAGAAKVESLLRSLRYADATPAGEETLLKALTELGFAEEASKVRAPTRATDARTIAPTDAPGFAEVSL